MLTLERCTRQRRNINALFWTFSTSRKASTIDQSPRIPRLVQAHNAPRHRNIATETSHARLQVYNSLSKTVESLDFLPASSAQEIQDANHRAPIGLAWYTCGPTVYAPAHLGHARTYVWLDIIRRVVQYRYNQIPFHPQQHRPPPPLFVLNITDVDDKILASASEAGEPPLDWARRFEAEFWRDLRALNCLPPHVVTRVTEHVESDIVPYIQRIMDNGMAYFIPEDGVYFDVRAFEDTNEKKTHKYGKLAPPSQASDLFDRQQPTITAQPKRDARDFCLWKLHKAGEGMQWPSPWGLGRPGWHIECSAMIQAVQDKMPNYRFQVHAGGIDLRFPHHTNEVAQAEAYHNSTSSSDKMREWIPHWLHTGHLHIDGLKMSKSLKNFITIEELLKDEVKGAWSSPADDFRLWCLGFSGSYRGMASYSKDGIDHAKQIRFEKLCQFLDQGEKWLDNNDSTSRSSKWTQEDIDLFHGIHECHDSCIRALYDDFDGSAFVKQLVLLCEMGLSRIRASPENIPKPQESAIRQALGTVRSLLELVGFSGETSKVGLVSDSASETHDEGAVGGESALIDELVKFRRAVRDAALTNTKDASNKRILQLCDEIRDATFPAIGVELYDGKEQDGKQVDSSWSYCIPREKEVTTATTTKTANEDPAPKLEDIPLVEFFKVGSFEGLFSSYDSHGFPILKADGTELSKSQQKKLRKKHEAHRLRLEKKDTS